MEIFLEKNFFGVQAVKMRFFLDHKVCDPVSACTFWGFREQVIDAGQLQTLFLESSVESWAMTCLMSSLLIKESKEICHLRDLDMLLLVPRWGLLFYAQAPKVENIFEAISGKFPMRCCWTWFLRKSTVFKQREAVLPTMERFPYLDPLHIQIVNFAGHVIEAQRPRLPDGSAGDGLHSEFPDSFRKEHVHIPQVIHYFASYLEQAKHRLDSSKSSQKYCSEVQAWSKYANIFYKVYPLILHNFKAD